MDFSAGYLLTMMFFSMVSMATITYGFKQKSAVALLGGLVLGTYLYFITDILLMWVVGICILGLMYVLRSRE
jgi:hypothetical protein